MYTTHGKSNTRLYSIWESMKARCYCKKHESYNDYGGRGIIICDKWNDSFQAFYDWAMNNGYADGLTIDRIDNDDIYKPDNCRWVTQFVQMQNQGIKSTNKSGHKGICYDPINEKWRVTITSRYKAVSIGRFDNLDDAIAARKSAEKEYWGKE